jgi:hypothetical protein
MNNADKPISPIFASDGFPIGATDTKQGELIGLTKREYFAAMAMQGMVYWRDVSLPFKADLFAAQAVQFADALLAELDKSK